MRQKRTLTASTNSCSKRRVRRGQRLNATRVRLFASRLYRLLCKGRKTGSRRSKIAKRNKDWLGYRGKTQAGKQLPGRCLWLRRWARRIPHRFRPKKYATSRTRGERSI